MTDERDDNRGLLSEFERNVYYVDHVSFWLDMKILLKTVAIILKLDGISIETSATMEEFLGSKPQ